MRRPIFFVGSSRDDLSSFPTRVKSLVGYALHLAQLGDRSEKAKPLKGLGSGVLEVVTDHDRETYRAVYTVRLTRLRLRPTRCRTWSEG